jgi:N-acetylglucosamine kinase-like BadF-type ATPase
VTAASRPARLLAVDGGASKTDAWIVDGDGRLLGRTRGPGSNHQLSGIDGALDALESTVAGAWAEVDGRVPIAVDVAVFCLAGIDFAVDEDRMGDAIARREWSSTTLVRNDTMAVLRAGARSGWGVAVVCGSGLNCVGLGPDGRVERFPSLAELSGDFCPGGAWLGVRTLGLALRAGDGRGGPTVLSEAVPAYFGHPDPESVLLAVYTGDLPYHRLFELARLCLDAAADGDTAAAGAVDQLADEVAAMVVAMIRRLGVAEDRPEIVLGGGLFDGGHTGFTDRIEAAVSVVAPGSRYRRLDAPPVLGAALLGLDALGADGPAQQRLRAAAPRTPGPDDG